MGGGRFGGAGSHGRRRLPQDAQYLRRGDPSDEVRLQHALDRACSSEAPFYDCRRLGRCSAFAMMES
jgi:hypothetical protein